MLKKYQPGRTDLLINTDWGIARDGLTPEGARAEKRLLFHGRWVTREERQQLRDAHHAYRSIRMLGVIVLVFGLVIIVNIGEISKGGLPALTIAVICIAAAATGGIGLIRFACWARGVCLLLLTSFLVLPFTPSFENEKGGPLLAITGAIGLYYLFRKTARKIFSPPRVASPAGSKSARPRVGNTIGIVLLIVALIAGYAVYDIGQAKRMAVDACARAKPGTRIDELLPLFSTSDYAVIRGSDSIIIVPRRGMGRNHCRVTHDGQKITGAAIGSAD